MGVEGGWDKRDTNPDHPEGSEEESTGKKGPDEDFLNPDDAEPVWLPKTTLGGVVKCFLRPRTRRVPRLKGVGVPPLVVLSNSGERDHKEED